MTNITSTPDAAVLRTLEDIRVDLRGDIRADQLSRAIYATDASIYEIVPDAVALPKCVDDVRKIVAACGRHRVPVTARGAGTGLAGGAVNRGMILDLSRHMNRVLAVDPATRTARVEPGVVLDELNALLAPHRLHFAPDVATSSRATIGGMIANNSCGAHSVYYGRTVDHIRSLDIVLSDGSLAQWPRAGDAPSALERNIMQTLRDTAVEYADDIAARFPRILRRNGGYALDRLRPDEKGRLNPETLICGSEGTLGIVVGATLNLEPLPRHTGMVVAHFHELLDALAATPAALEHTPAAVELLDKLILDAARRNLVMQRRRWLVEGDPRGLLIIELYDDDESRLRARLDALVLDLASRGMGFAHPVLTDADEQADLWHIRKSGLGLLMSTPGDRQTYDFVEDTAVDPTKLREYIARFMRVLEDEGVPDASYYAHASVGCLHVKPILNLKCAADIAKMHRIADRISSLALEFGGTMTGEHGDGILRSEWLAKMYGPRIIEAFCKVKAAFDPHGILNPGKIVDPYPMIGSFRYGEAYQASAVDTTLDFSGHGGMAGLAEMCSGVGQCRQKLVGTMCPSYMATGDERHTTRARANALRLALSNRDALRDLEDPALDEVMDLCLSCKACKTECPTGVDMAKLKAEWQWMKIRRDGAPLRSRLIARIADISRMGAFAPGIANRLAQSRFVRAMLDRTLGIDRRVPPPRFADKALTRRITSLLKRDGHPAYAGDAHSNTVVYFIDTWTRYFIPQVGLAAVRLLEALGRRVIVPDVGCCGRPAISKGLLGDATRMALRNVDTLAEYAAAGIPILTTEPSCHAAIIDEWPQLVRTDAARRIAALAAPAESYILRAFTEDNDRAQRLKPLSHPVRLHGHCHQKAMTGTDDALALLQLATGGRAIELNTGCCGMAGSFGHESEHYDVASAIGEQRLFPAVRERGGAEIAVTGFSCRHQIEHHTCVHARHVLEIVASALLNTPV